MFKSFQKFKIVFRYQFASLFSMKYKSMSLLSSRRSGLCWKGGAKNDKWIFSLVLFLFYLSIMLCAGCVHTKLSERKENAELGVKESSDVEIEELSKVSFTPRPALHNENHKRD